MAVEELGGGVVREGPAIQAVVLHVAGDHLPGTVGAAAVEVVPPQPPWKSEAEIGEVAVAYRDAGMRHQQAIEGTHHSIEQVAGRR